MLGSIISGIIVTVLMTVMAILALGPAYLEARQWWRTNVDRTQKSLLVTFLVLFVVLCALTAAVYFASGERSGGRHAIQPPEAIPGDIVRIPATWWQGSVPSGRPVLGAWRVGGTFVCRVVFSDDYGTVYEYWGDGMKAWAVETDPLWWTELPGSQP